jgi:hypothetical protein
VLAGMAPVDQATREGDVFAKCTRCKTRDGENWKSLTRWAPHPKAALGAVDVTQVGHGVRRRRAVVAAAAALLLVALTGCTGSATSDAEDRRRAARLRP